MDYEAIYKVSTALRERVQQGYTAAGGAGNGVYVGPLDDPDAAGAKLILFLYRIAPNPSMRNAAHTVPSPVVPPATITYRDSLPLDLYYLLTLGDASGESADLEQLKFLGSAMQVLHREPVLSGIGVAHEPVKLTLDPLGNEDMSRLWALFPTVNYRTSVAYLASPVWIDPLKPDAPGAPVIRDGLDSGQRERVLQP
ncbi:MULTISPECIES: DUF4255 domain-containing protein [unclassified Duganella]|uniref:DUF4255 domain-containing protein n=1 Tax=unclassified Duganella TaxID=2636909 RepID=UPI000874530C|nr:MULTISPECIES: DUF4255 domain-containing protein [unclassified Duganella]OEZ63926.1 hypothetical protein DUGA6_04270 [Duganella sp. HH105]OFA06922.1 hypothetical protein DUGA2_02540 [Duganella sp. HH101]